MHKGRRYALVAGGAGFVGSHLVDSLVKDGWYVDVLDNMSTGSTKNLRDTMQSNVVAHDGEQLLRIQFCDVATLRMDPCRLNDDGDKALSCYDVIYNLASPASPKAYQSDPIATVMTNVVGAANLLALSEAHRSVFVQASTSEIYGDPKEHPQRETYWGNVNSYGKRACYDESKRCAETLCYEYRQRGVDVRVARIFNTYGPRMEAFDGRVVSNFVRQALTNEPLTIYGDGSQTRSFCYVSDLVAGLRKLADAPSWDHGPVNLGNDGEFTITELVEILSEWFPGVLAVNEPLPQDDPTVRKPDLTLAKKFLGYSPSVSLREGLARTIQFMK